MRPTYEEESQIEVRQRRPGKDQLDRVVDEFEEENELSNDIVPTRKDSEEMKCCMNSSKERSVEPSTSLRNELRDSRRDIRRRFCALYVSQPLFNLVSYSGTRTRH